MRPKLVVAGGLILVGIVAIGFGVFRYFQSQKPNSGLKIETTPQAIVFVDNVQIGQTPIDKMFKSGEITLRIAPAGGDSAALAYVTKVKLTPQFYTVVRREFGDSDTDSSGDTVFVEDIPAKNASMTITVSGPDSASVSIDGQNYGPSPVLVSSINPGNHQITASAPGYISRNVNANAIAGNKTVVQIKLAQELEATNPPEVDTTPTPTPDAADTTPTPTKKVSKITPTPTAGKTKVTKIEIKDTPTGFLRVREQSSTTSKEIGRVNPGETYTVLETKTGWYKIEIETDDASFGWVSATYATPSKEQ